MEIPIIMSVMHKKALFYSLARLFQANLYQIADIASCDYVRYFLIPVNQKGFCKRGILMHMIKNLLFFTIFLTQVFSSNVSCCAKRHKNSIEEGSISILNITNIDLFISFLSATNGNTTPIFEQALPTMSFTTAILDEEERLQNLTISIFLAKPQKHSKKYPKKHTSDSSGEDLVEKSVTFVLQPKSIIGLADIKLRIENDQLIAYLSYLTLNSVARNELKLILCPIFQLIPDKTGSYKTLTISKSGAHK